MGTGGFREDPVNELSSVSQVYMTVWASFDKYFVSMVLEAAFRPVRKSMHILLARAVQFMIPSP